MYESAMIKPEACVFKYKRVDFDISVLIKIAFLTYRNILRNTEYILYLFLFR